MADLKPCPFCGSTDVGARKRGPVWRQWVRVNCFYCSTVGPPGTYLEQAVRLWNRRAVVAAHDQTASAGALKVGDLVEWAGAEWVVVVVKEFADIYSERSGATYRVPTSDLKRVEEVSNG